MKRSHAKAIVEMVSICWQNGRGADDDDAVNELLAEIAQDHPDLKEAHDYMPWPETLPQPRFVCRACGKGAEEINGYLTRVNPIGEIPARWECVPPCEDPREL